jgi:hypothetical protein
MDSDYAVDVGARGRALGARCRSIEVRDGVIWGSVSREA